jgi:predicted phage terminase large subunit-like protein
LDAGTWTTTGIEREQTSQHYDLIIADDLHGRENVMTKEQRDKVKLYYKDMMSLLDPGGRIVIIGTRWSIDDLYGDLLEREDWDCMVKTCYKEDGSPLFPERYTLEKLAELRREKGSLEFSGQYLNSPVDEENAPFKSKHIKYWYNLQDVPPTYKFLSIDPSLTQKRESDYTGLMVVGMDKNGAVWVHDYVRKKLLPKEIISETFRLVEKWNLTQVGIECYGYSLSLKYSMLDEQKNRGKYFSVNEMRKPKAKENKESFILRLQPYLEAGQIKIKDTMNELVDEFIAFPRGKHDDLLDCLAYSLDYLHKASVDMPNAAPKEGTYRWWVENKIAKPKGDIYYNLLKDLERR